jgi:hypothetical protein
MLILFAFSKEEVAAKRIHLVANDTPLLSALSPIHSEAQQQLWLSRISSSVRYS